MQKLDTINATQLAFHVKLHYALLQSILYMPLLITPYWKKEFLLCSAFKSFPILVHPRKYWSIKVNQVKHQQRQPGA